MPQQTTFSFSPFSEEYCNARRRRSSPSASLKIPFHRPEGGRGLPRCRLMIAGRHRDEIHQFAHGLASTRSTENPAFIRSATRLSFSSLLRNPQTCVPPFRNLSSRRDSFFNDGGIDTLNYSARKDRDGRSILRAHLLARKRVCDAPFRSRGLRGAASRRSHFPGCCPRERIVSSEERREYPRFHDGESIVSHSIAMCVGRGGFQDQRISRLSPPSFRAARS